MDGPTTKRKVTVARLASTYTDVSPASSRPSSRPASPTKSFVSTSSPLAARPKAKVNSSAIRRTPSSATTTAQLDSPVNHNRPPSPVKFTSAATSRIRDGALSQPASAVGVANRKPTVVRVKPSPSVSSGTSSKLKSSSPELRNRSLTASSDALRPQPDSRKRQGSAAAVLHHAVSSSSLQPRSPSPSPSTLMRTGGPRVAQIEPSPPSDAAEINTDGGVYATQPIKIRSKVSSVARNLSDTLPAPEPAPSTLITRPVTARVRAVSVSSNVSYTATTNNPASPPHPIPTTAAAYPITTATPAANPHRYPTARASPTTSVFRSNFSSPSSPKYTPQQQSDEFRPFAKTSIFSPSPSSHSAANSISNGYSCTGSSGGNTKTIDDPANIPLPPQSPPASSLSVSSHSSVSATSPESSVSFNFNLKKRRDASPQRQSLRDTLDTLHAYASAREEDLMLDDGPNGMTTEQDEERKVRAEAKSNRKIADLEITNRSLLSINASLEKTKDRQAKEIRELKRKLRESRLILPPRAYEAVKSSLDPEEIGDDEEDIESSSGDDDDPGPGVGAKGKSHETYARIKLMLENLLDSGRRALEKTKEDYMEAKGGTKVLTAEEVETWRDSAGDLGIDCLSDSGSHLDRLDNGFDDDDNSTRPRSHSPTPQPATRNGGVAGLGLRNSNIPSPSPSPGLSSPRPPPILITESP